MAMPNFKHNLLSTLASMVLGIASGWSAVAHADLSIADVPLYLAASAEPNVMFTLDDSGSMQWESMPDDLIRCADVSDEESDPEWRCTYYLYPAAASVYGAGDYRSVLIVPDFDPSNGFNAAMRSPNNNNMYYNPAITYKPWVKSDGSGYANANITCAPHNPQNTAAGCRDLTASNTSTVYWLDKSGKGAQTSKTYWPAVYYKYNSGGIWNAGSYTRVEIRPSTASYTGGPKRSDCAAAPTCTYAEEIQNFANWYTYYRSRILSARAGVGRAFAQQKTAMRVGFGTINKGATTVDSVDNTSTVIRGVREFVGSDRDAFFNSLYSRSIPTSGTPLRKALQNVGEYFKRKDDAGPWGKSPGSSDSTPHLECRQSYHILMTDGYWNGSNPSSINNEDKSTGPSITDPAGRTYQYIPANPYQDEWSKTLADVAMKYWYSDLRDDLANKVPSSTADPAVWQHLVNFTVGLGVTGSLDPRSDLPALTSGAKTWPNPGGTSSIPAKIDDLWHAAVNSRGKFFSAKDPDTFANALADTLSAIADRVESSASSVAANSTRLDTDTLVYQARFDSRDWSGELLAFSLNEDGTLVTPEKWDAGKLIPAPSSRNIFTLNDATSNGVAFTWSNLSSTQKLALNTNIDGVVDGSGSARVSWLRGDTSAEVRSGGAFRDRTQTVLGDIINSDPYYAGRQDFGYSILPTPEGDAYVAFRSSASYKGRPDMLYVGANDGMLHGFDATTGAERLAYVPANLYPRLSKLTAPTYEHEYFVDGSPRVGDAFVDLGGGKEWHSILVGSTGAGGRSVFGLDVTDPESFSASNVLWELTDSELGYSIGQPTIARLAADDRWVAIFGNGYNSASHKAQLFIVDLATGSIVKKIDTGVGSSASPNGLSTPVPVDTNGDRITDYIYAGDLHGNLWKFDVSDPNISKWKVAYKSGSTPSPLFQAKDSAGTPQPITVRPTVGRNPSGGVMVYFGTGKYFEVGDGTVPASPQAQSFYGIWDNNAAVSGRSALRSQSILFEGSRTFGSINADVRAVSNNTVDYSSKKGWYLDLVYDGNKTSERVVSSALFRHGRIIFTTLIPSGNPCDSGGSSWLMELDALNGKRLDYTVIDLNEDGEFDSKEYVRVTLSDGTEIDVPVSGNRSKEGIIRTPGVVSAGDREYKYASGSSGGIERTVEKGDPNAGRKSWRQLR